MQQFLTSDPTPVYRQPPHNLEIEQGILGALLINNRDLERVDGLLPDDFFDVLHGAIFERIVADCRAGRLATPVTLKSVFANITVGELGGAQYLGFLAARAAASSSLADYARALRDDALRRRLIVVGEDLVRDAFDGSRDRTGQAILEATEEQLHALAPAGPNERAAKSLAASLSLTLRSIGDLHAAGGGLAGLPTGFAELDTLLGGLRPGTLNIFAGRPSMGKTALATSIAKNVAAEGHAVVLVSLEMSARELDLRLLSGETGIPVQRLQTGLLFDGEMPRLLEAEERLGQLPLTVDDSSALTIAQLHARARRLRRQGRLDLLALDYLGLVRPSTAYAGNRVHEIGEVTAGLKAIAKELDIPILVLAQLNRQVESRDNKRPTLSDLRDSGSIEQDADAVIFVFREEYYVERDKPSASDRSAYADWLAACEAAAGKAELIISKNRQGGIGTVDLLFDAKSTRFCSAPKDIR